MPAVIRRRWPHRELAAAAVRGNLLDRQWPHQAALPAEALRGAENSMPIHALAKELAGEPPRYRLQRDGRDFTVFCFATAEAAQTFHERFGGELLPLSEPRRRH